MRQGLVALLGYEADLAVVADVERGEVVVPAALRTRPDVAVIDIDLPGRASRGSRAARAAPGVPHAPPRRTAAAAELRRALAAGVLGPLGKDVPAEELAAATRRVAAGERGSTRNSPWPRRGAGEPADAP
ncbi:hypothetical protein AB0A71_07220 [Kitasatospora aureofaciens]|uniref:hypothetical protein n=1 Tax=Kitasatospora aureofaciens TaxID=1894 RepID=UPI003409B3E6